MRRTLACVFLGLAWSVLCGAGSSFAAAQSRIAPCPEPRTVVAQRVFEATPEAVKLAPSGAAGELNVNGSVSGSAPLPTRDTAGVLAGVSLVYHFNLDARESAVLSLAAESNQTAFNLALYSCDGRAISATYAAAPEQQLFIAAGATELRGLVEVTLENPREDRSGAFTLSAIPAAAGNAPSGTLAHGYAYRRAFDADDYQHLIEFGACDSAAGDEMCEDTCGDECRGRVHEILRTVIGADAATKDEPVVAFLGIAGLNRIVLFDEDGDGQRVPPHYRTLGRAKHFWTAYIEDALAPFDTSIDVEFKQRSSVGDYEEFDPAGLVSSRARREGHGRAIRVVRIGLRRFRVRQPPVVIEVAFSRQGAGYGLRQWQRAYKVHGWKPVALSGGLFVPATEVFVNTHEVVERERLGDELPIDALIVQRHSRRQVFAVGSVLWPQRRARADEATRLASQILWRGLPEVVFGVGLPTTNQLAFYLGGGWPVAWDRLSVTAGAILIRQNKLSAPHYVGERVPLKTDVDRLTYSSAVLTFSFGLTVDLVRSR